MTNTKLNTFRKALEHKQAELGDGVRSREVLAIERSSDEMDRTQQASDREYAIDRFERSSKRIDEIRAALGRIHAGTYGVCTECEDFINPRRLLALPWATLCIACQEAADREYKITEFEMDNALQMSA